MPMGGGGGQMTGGTVVQSTNPGGAMLAGNLQTSAVDAAINAARDQTQTAMNAIRQNYSNAFMDLKPYSQTGIQALDELNSYLGLKAYDPGTAPKAPISPTLEAEMAKITGSNIRDYITQNTNPYDFQSKNGLPGLTYQGAGAFNTVPITGGIAIGTSVGGPASMSGLQNLIMTGQGNGVVITPEQSKSVMDAIRHRLAEDNLPRSQAEYDSLMPQYNQQMDMYNYAKGLQGQYANPLTPDQVSAKLAQTPGYQFQLGQGVDAIQRAASASGQLGGGGMLQALVNYGQGMASQTYSDTLNRLAALAGSGQQAATGTAQGSMNLGNNLASLNSQLGDTIANGLLARGNALSQATLAGSQKFDIMGQQRSGGSSGLGGLGSLIGAAGGLFGSGGAFGAGGAFSGLFK